MRGGVSPEIASGRRTAARIARTSARTRPVSRSAVAAGRAGKLASRWAREAVIEDNVRLLRNVRKAEGRSGDRGRRVTGEDPSGTALFPHVRQPRGWAAV